MSVVPRTYLGSGRFETSAIGFGTMGISMSYGPTDIGEAIRTIEQAHDDGVTMFDTAERYSGAAGSSEEILGRAVASFRDEVELATKFGFDYSGSRASGFDSRPERIRDAVNGSLQALRTDRIDLLYQHRVDPDVPIEDVAGTVGELIMEGKVKAFGLSKAPADVIRRAHEVQAVTAVQDEYSVLEREIEYEVLPTIRELGIGLVAFAPLARGFLTSDVRPAEEYAEGDYRRTAPRWQSGAFEANAVVVQRLEEVATSFDAAVSQVALAWVLSRGRDVVPIVGVRNRLRLAENLRAVGLATNGDLVTAIERVV